MVNRAMSQIRTQGTPLLRKLVSFRVQLPSTWRDKPATTSGVGKRRFAIAAQPKDKTNARAQEKTKTMDVRAEKPEILIGLRIIFCR